MNIIIDKEFESLIPPLDNDEFQKLEKSILEYGCLDPLKVWEEPYSPIEEFDSAYDIQEDANPVILFRNPVLVDGHNRYKICQKHNIPFKTVEVELDDRDDVKLWIIRNQLGRRNLKEWDRFDLAKSLEEIEKRKARERMSDGGKGKEIFPDLKGQSRDVMGSMVGVSGKTYDKMKAIDESDDERLKQQVRNGDISISKGYQIATGKEIKTKSPAKAKQERIDRAKEEHEEFKESKTVSIAQVQMDKANRQIIASNLYVRLMGIGKRIEDVVMEMEQGDIDLKEMCKTLDPDKIKTLTDMFRTWNHMLVKLDKEVRNN